jgi:hypothetical protein
MTTRDGIAPARNYTDRTAYLLAELRVASIKARLWQADIDSVGLALKGSLISPEQALEMLQECDCLHLIVPHEAAA